jgi:hypothetical protein
MFNFMVKLLACIPGYVNVDTKELTLRICGGVSGDA